MRSSDPCLFLKIPITHAGIVKDYIQKHQAALKNDLNWYSQPLTWNDKIKRAVASIGQPKQPNQHQPLHQHQWRLRKSVYGAAQKKLLTVSTWLSQAKAFDDLYDAVKTQISSVSGVGPLYLYDISLRLGNSNNLKPTTVYLHAGALKGAQKILKVPVHQGRSTHKSSFPTLASLDPFEIENLLCLYENCL
jgi:hypothetical protein